MLLKNLLPHIIKINQRSVEPWSTVPTDLVVATANTITHAIMVSTTLH